MAPTLESSEWGQETCFPWIRLCCSDMIKIIEMKAYVVKNKYSMTDIVCKHTLHSARKEQHY